VLEAMSRLGRDIMETVLTGLEPAARELLAAYLLTMKSNLRDAIANRADEVAAEQSQG
jgi:hypothetical protein